MKKIKELAEKWGPLVIRITVLTTATYVSEWIVTILSNKIWTILTKLFKKK